MILYYSARYDVNSYGIWTVHRIQNYESGSVSCLLVPRGARGRRRPHFWYWEWQRSVHCWRHDAACYVARRRSRRKWREKSRPRLLFVPAIPCSFPHDCYFLFSCPLLSPTFTAINFFTGFLSATHSGRPIAHEAHVRHWKFTRYGWWHTKMGREWDLEVSSSQISSLVAIYLGKKSFLVSLKFRGEIGSGSHVFSQAANRTGSSVRRIFGNRARSEPEGFCSNGFGSDQGGSDFNQQQGKKEKKIKAQEMEEGRRIHRLSIQHQSRNNQFTKKSRNNQ